MIPLEPQQRMQAAQIQYLLPSLIDIGPAMSDPTNAPTVMSELMRRCTDVVRFHPMGTEGSS